MYLRFLVLCAGLLLMGHLQAAQAWKPSTHVYLALAALDEVTSSVDLLGAPKPVNHVAFYRVHHQTGTIIERLGTYQADPALVSALTAHRRAFIMGLLGPDAYPDIATGQQRIHVRHPVYSDQWLQYLWQQAQGQDSSIRAFVLGYLGHAIGDMFMHTFVNHFAGGEFSVDVERSTGHPLNFNGARHVIFESYIGARAPQLAAADYDIGASIEEPLREFIYRHLADARTIDHPDLSPRTNTVFGRSVLVSKPYLGQAAGGLDYESSVPRYFSDLRDGLVGYLRTVDDTVVAIDQQIAQIYRDAEVAACPVNVTCSSSVDQQTAACVTACAGATVLATPHIVRKTAFQAANAGPYTYIKQEWVPNIDNGLRRWIDLNHQVARLLMYAREGESSLAAVRDSVQFYRDVHLPGMLGLPSAVGQYAAFSRSVKEMVFGDVQAVVDALRDNLLEFLFSQAFGMTPDEFQHAYASPEALFDDVLPRPYQAEEGLQAMQISLNGLHQMLGIEGDEPWDSKTFPPAWNTITLIKMSMLSQAGLLTLLQDLGVDCGGGSCLSGANPALGFMRSLDESRQWLPDHPATSLDDPAFAPHKSDLSPFVLEECAPYAQIFMQQLGEAGSGFQAQGRFVEARPCPPMVALAPPVILPPGGPFGEPVTVTIEPPAGLTPAERQATAIYYTMSVAGQEVDPVRPEGGVVDSRIRPYTGPFQVYPPLDPAQLPITVRARAYHPDFLASAVAEAPFDVDARLQTPVFSRASGEYLEPFSVTLTLPDNPGGAAIYYTLTGEDPNYNDTFYSGPIALSRGTHDLRVVAYRPGYVRSEIGRAEYRIFAPEEVERAETPYFTSPRGSGTYVGSATVTIATDSPGGKVRWALRRDAVPDTPTALLGNDYLGPIPLGLGNWFIRAVTVKDGVVDSPVAQINVNVVEPLGTTSPVVVSPAGGVFHNDVQVRLASAVTFENVQGQIVVDSSGMQIQYTLDGSEPDINPNFNPAENRRYLQPFFVRRSSTLRAIAHRTFFPISQPSEVTFSMVVATPSFDRPSGVYYDSVRVALSTVTSNATIRYTLDGSDPTELSATYVEPILITQNTPLRARAFRNGYTFSEIADATYMIHTSAPPAIVRQPRDLAVVLGEPARFVVQASGQPEPDVQWWFDGELIPNATDDTLHLPSVQLSHAGPYEARISNPVGTATTAAVRLTVLPVPVAPEILVDLPEVLEVSLGEPALFGVTASGAPEPAYRWLRNGNLLPGLNASAIAYEAVTLAQAGTYQVVVENPAGTDSSATMQLVVRVAESVTAESTDDLPDRFELGQNYPNPFNPTTAIPFTVPEAAHVRLTIYDVAGRRVAIVVDNDFAPGRYSARFDASGLASGIYLYRLETATWSDVRKLVLLR